MEVGRPIEVVGETKVPRTGSLDVLFLSSLRLSIF